MVTTIQLEENTKEKLAELRSYPGESYNQVIVRLINLSEEEMEILDKETIKDIEEAIADIKAGKFYTHEEMKKRLGLE
ncbi:MAG: hypothetical protein COY38_03960 [Candidatus Aenigmarchaeota archaeon CG_4_10_14_0_8_um_filter_37_24]|nr:hypothetical protein [Candidatus Aenigmarchaeota archaeon]OIN86582.1 MAG: hypothetical protein AUJ50_03800 [Candidatus Aenigmarchaeota archaeon CG1_02_38_14]PIV69403.1 MAG: hypothetical protein COS07_00940 [Candidatus Aenigmarchaeota archaeon CG01_land_8_20_14_3_00_37_9]PIW41717.1 MAG: hypothetical protein COW21_00485 [Candidatus Aenigmarchaeota archaeon CG15_BIG_FIL_POST_REV_8_21_14_020_37_27]PIX50536.1 MAG: hypothetical protein COZ52_03415 [Candidatus Aenigmarchaeota archaeon CG_4_8_14_3_u